MADMHDVVALCSELSNLSSADGGLDEIVDVVAARTAHDAILVDPGLSPIAASTGSGGADGAERFRDRIAADAEPLRELTAAASSLRRALSLPAFGDDTPVAITVAPVVVGNDCVAYFVLAATPTGDDEDSRILVTEHAAMVAAVILGRRRIVAVAAGAARRELFDGLILVGDRDVAKATDWARHLGIAPESRQRVLLAVLQSPDDAGAPGAPEGLGARATTMLEQMIAARCPSATVVDRGTEVVALVTGDDDRASSRQLIDVARRCRAALAARFPSVSVVFGLSDAHTGAATISMSYTEARRAVDVGAALPAMSDVVVFSELGVHRLLAHVRDPQDLKAYARQVLGPLLDYDAANSSNSMETLSVYFRQNSSPKRAAALLHTHPNTIAYRVRRAEEILGLDLDAYRDRLAVELALEIATGIGDTDWTAS